MAGRSLGIGELAAQASLRPSALRYYEQIGLIPPPERIGGQRAYPPATVRRIALIRMAQQAGLPLAEIRALVTGATPGTSATRHWRDWPSASGPRSTPRSGNSASYAAASRPAWHAAACTSPPANFWGASNPKNLTTDLSRPPREGCGVPHTDG